MTLLDILTATCFMTPIIFGIGVGREAGGVGIMIGLVVGLVAGGLASYAFRKTYWYFGKLEERLTPQVVQWVSGIMVFTPFLIIVVAAALMAGFLTTFIVQQMAG